MPQALFKLCIFGDGGVGKTTLIQKYLLGIFIQDTRMTIGVDFHVKKLIVENLSVHLQIWDFAGEDRFRFLLPNYLKGASGGIFMYDITRFTSLNNLDKWLNALKQDSKGSRDQIPLFLVGGKIDLAHKRAIETSYGEEAARSRDLSGFAECSAKTGENVDLVFEAITKIMLEKAGML